MRHMPPDEAKQLRKANRVAGLMCGLIIAGVASVPILNLITPLFATAFMRCASSRDCLRVRLRLAPRPAS
jgi:CysZ protein